nr:hypothetical protein CFP56_01035 [Quercus suber]
MASRSSIQRLPLELLEYIVGYLAITDVCKLSLTNRELASHLARNTSFRSCFDTKTIELSHEHVEAVAVLTQQAWIASEAQQLRIIGVADLLAKQGANGGDSVMSDDEWERTLLGHLTTALTNIRRHSTNRGHWDVLSVDVESCGKNDHHTFDPLIWDGLGVYRRCGHMTARVTAKVLKTSHLEADKIDVFGNTRQFALIPSEIALFNEAQALGTCTSLSLAVSAGNENAAEDKDDEEENTSAQVLPVEAIQMLNGTKSLVHLHLRWYEFIGISRHKQKLGGNDSDLLAPMVEPSSCSLPQLRSLSLGGFYTTEKSLLAFLPKYSGLRSLVLEEIHLRKGSFRTIFAHLDDQTGLKSLYLNDLWEDRLIYFSSASGKPHVPGKEAPTWMKRSRSQRLRSRPIRYYSPTSPAKASAAGLNVSIRRRELYGPS